ncbi:hypothetical protein ACS0TY_017518 [Phlomoides rotata]
MALGIIIHDAEGEFVSCRTVVVLRFFRVDEGEVMGLLEALSWIKQLGFEKVIFEVDAKLVFDALAVMVGLVPRSANIKAHYLDRASKTFLSPEIWVVPPMTVEDLPTSTCIC